MSFRVLVTGSRVFADATLMRNALLTALRYANGRPLTIVHGAARGADTLSQTVGMQCLPADTVFEAHPADWSSHGRSAGHRRNASMVSLGADLVLAFFVTGVDSRGTSGCVALASGSGIPIIRFRS